MTGRGGPPPGTELLDDPAADDAAVRRSLRNIARANRLFGGWRAVRVGLTRLLARHDATALTLLDVGTGAGDLPRRAERWAASRGLTLRTVGLERHPSAARLARGPDLPLLLGCGGALPIRNGAVDIVTLSQVAHHLDPQTLAAVAGEAGRVARVGVVVADLRPGRLAGLGFRMAGTLLGFDEHTVRDGVTSLGRGFTEERLRRELAAAGITPWITTASGQRIVAVWRTDGRPA